MTTCRHSLLAFLFMCLLVNPAQGSSVHKSHVEVELMTDAQAIKPGQTFWIGLKMKMDEGWHTYWRNSGDSGLSTHITWDMPVGFGAGDIQWPTPKRFDYASGLVGYGYDGEVILLTEFWAPEDGTIGKDLLFAAQVRWLACQEICVPGSAYLTITLNEEFGSAEELAEVTDQFNKTKLDWPVVSEDWDVSVVLKERVFLMDVKPMNQVSAPISGMMFFPYRNDIIDHSAVQAFKITEGGYRLLVPQAVLVDEKIPRLQGILLAPEGWTKDKRKALFVDAYVN